MAEQLDPTFARIIDDMFASSCDEEFAVLDEKIYSSCSEITPLSEYASESIHEPTDLSSLRLKRSVSFAPSFYSDHPVTRMSRPTVHPDPIIPSAIIASLANELTVAFPDDAVLVVQPGALDHLTLMKNLVWGKNMLGPIKAGSVPTWCKNILLPKDYRHAINEEALSHAVVYVHQNNNNIVPQRDSYYIWKENTERAVFSSPLGTRFMDGWTRSTSFPGKIVRNIKRTTPLPRPPQAPPHSIPTAGPIAPHAAPKTVGLPPTRRELEYGRAIAASSKPTEPAHTPKPAPPQPAPKPQQQTSHDPAPKPIPGFSAITPFTSDPAYRLRTKRAYLITKYTYLGIRIGNIDKKLAAYQ